MKIKITTDYRVDLASHMINSYDESRLSPINSVLRYFVNCVPTECISEFTDEGSLTRSKLEYKITKITKKANKSISVETEYFAVAAKVCSYLKSKGVDYEIELSEKLYFYQENPDDIAEIYLKTEPNTKVCKEMYGIKDENSIMNPNFVNFQFAFDTAFFQTNEVTESMVVDAVQECEVCFTDNARQVTKKITKSEISSIKFINYALEQILEWLECHRDILNTPYLDLEDVLLENDLIMEEPNE